MIVEPYFRYRSVIDAGALWARSKQKECDTAIRLVSAERHTHKQIVK